MQIVDHVQLDLQHISTRDGLYEVILELFHHLPSAMKNEACRDELTGSSELASSTLIAASRALSMPWTTF